jgi:undecaprenol kinase
MQRLINSFKYAFYGLKTSLKEKNMRIHVVGASLALLLGILLNISHIELAMIFICISLVISLEIVNTAIEDTCNILRDSNSLDYEATKSPRDLAAAAVLVAAFFSLMVGVIIFVPRILEFLI